MFFHRKYVIFQLTIITLLLTACTTLYEQPLEQHLHYLTWNERQHQLSKINNWNTNGALGITYDNKETMAHFYWQQIADRFAVNIYTPLNLGGVKITGDQEQIILWKSVSKKLVAKTPEQLMYKELGWSIPLLNMRYWILGLPAPRIAYKAKFDSYNHLSFLEQQGWQIKYDDFRSIDNVDLPAKIWLSAPQLQVKLVVKEWRISR